MVQKSIRREIAIRILEREELRQACGVETCSCCHGAGFSMTNPTRKCKVCKGTGKEVTHGTYVQSKKI